MDREELAWAAGFFDGEGSIGCYRKDERRPASPMLQVSQVDRFVLDRFQAALGGVGGIGGPYKPKTANSSTYYTFRSQKFSDVQHIVATLWFWLSPQKRQDAHKALAAHRDWINARTCSVGHVGMKSSKGRSYCPTCKAAAGKSGGTAKAENRKKARNENS
jgi:hypothetical protein